ncbi:MAG: cytochrome c oxidase subunit 3 family protein [Acidobacteria bacterium]|nr:cytochrome c oxidase subunit 3 family protein [Acidobacteriota bacterium]
MAHAHTADEIHLTDSEEHARSALAHHFDNLEQQREAGSLGMWVFLITEIMFFGGLFTGYVVYRMQNQASFAFASSTLNWKLGAVNTVILIGSSLTMALAVYFAQVGSRRNQIIFLALTTVLGSGFLVVKGLEYAEKIHDKHVPIRGFWNWGTAHPLPAGVQERSVEMFYWIYFAMTGLHALHMIIGIGMMLVLIFFARRGRYTPEYHAPVELGGLYWHFVDIVWIFLFPLLYLLGANIATHGGGH